eukprot:2193031-Prorocentrum_lima.AAC.1
MVYYDNGQETKFQTYHHASPFYFLGAILSAGVLLQAGSKIDNEYSGTYTTGGKHKSWHKVAAVHLFESTTYPQWCALSQP